MRKVIVRGSWFLSAAIASAMPIAAALADGDTGAKRPLIIQVADGDTQPKRSAASAWLTYA